MLSPIKMSDEIRFFPKTGRLHFFFNSLEIGRPDFSILNEIRNLECLNIFNLIELYRTRILKIKEDEKLNDFKNNILESYV